MSKFLFGLLLGWGLLGGVSCIGSDDTKPGQAYATDIVWQQQYAMIGRPAPTITWMEADSLNCYDGHGWTSYSVGPIEGGAIDGGTGTCVAGLNFVGPPDSAFVAWPTGTTFISQTAFAHELCHAWSYQTTGDPDAQHLGPCFNPPGSYVQIANDALAQEDL
jgi:hypothetical protein